MQYAALMSRRRRAAVLSTLLLTTVLACRNSSTSASSAATPVFIICIDTLRADRLSAYGYQKSKQPAIDRFRSDSILYSRAFTQAPQTLVAHASIFTGLLPPAHGVRDNVGYVLDPAKLSLATRLSAAGYVTGAAVSSYVLRRATKINEGFQFYDDDVDFASAARRTLAERPGEETRQALERWLDSIRDNRRIFGFLHIYEPHAPYEPPATSASIRDPYDGEIAESDRIVGRFMESLEQRDLYDDALVILLSDHGEGLGDHGEDEHGVFLYREVIHVPLLVKLPKQKNAGTTVNAPVALMDVFPTVLDAAGVRATEKIDAVVLPENDTTAAQREIYSESYFSRLHFGWSELRSLIGDEYHFIEAPTRELYRYVTDPREETNLAATARREAFALAERLRSIDPQFQGPSFIDPEDQRKLAALGYLGSSGEKTEGPLPDPKTKVQTLRDLRRSFSLFYQGEYEKAVVALRGFVEREPEIADGWSMLGESLRRSGRTSEAIDVLRNGLRRFPSNSGLAMSLAEAFLQRGEYEEARAHAELAVLQEGAVARELLARIALASNDVAGAERQLEKALSQKPKRVEAILLLADLRRKQGRRPEQLALLNEAKLEIERRRLPAIAGLDFQRGEALLELRRVPEAEKAFRQEAQNFPSNRQAWSSLALTVGAQGRREEARTILLEALRRNHDRRMFELVVESFDIMGDREGLAAARSNFRSVG